MKNSYILYIFLCLSSFYPEVMYAAAVKKVYISQYVDHPALNQTTQGIIDGLEALGYKKGDLLDLKIESTQASSVLASQIAAKFMSQKPDVVVGVATLSAQSFIKYVNKQKVNLIFSSVTDPIQANLVQSLEHPGGYISGVSNFVDLEPQIQLFQQIQPNLKTLGFLYNPSEANSISLIDRLKKICLKHDIKLVLQAATKSSELAQSAAKLASQVDAIFISNDSTALSGLQVIIQAATKCRIPVYVSDTDAVSLGAIAALGPNQYAIGLQTAQMIVQILEGASTNSMPVQFPQHTQLYLNEKAAEKIGLAFSDTLKKQADLVIEAAK